MIFSATFAGVAVTAAQDVWELVAPATTKVRLRELRVAQYSDAGDAEAELISIQVIRGNTTTGTGGTTVTPVNLRSWSRAATATVKRNNTTVAANGTAAVLIADTFNVASGFWYRPPVEEMIYLDNGERLVVRITAPADALTTSSTLIFEETPAV